MDKQLIIIDQIDLSELDGYDDMHAYELDAESQALKDMKMNLIKAYAVVDRTANLAPQQGIDVVPTDPADLLRLQGYIAIIQSFPKEEVQNHIMLHKRINIDKFVSEVNNDRTILDGGKPLFVSEEERIAYHEHHLDNSNVGWYGSPHDKGGKKYTIEMARRLRHRKKRRR